ncbi:MULTISPECIES: hypothetical protein [Clostridium]|uniref:hypothetical protein n=1 Tax=Clostridium TaxID=1485 RepID=UPI0008248E86|nr:MULTISPECIES: hypothetical protein [Clostridium]PJI06545.1 hypothetical protein CUB90_01100 [Clostridium sp. CT7]
MCKSTDVSGSIAGYYYQILLACKELTSNIDEIKEIGIETGADVRVIKYKNEKQSIEAKFHKLNIGMYNKDIIKTIYNFYRYSSDDSKLTLSTNVTSTKKDRDFFRKWINGGLDEKQKIIYIKKCILRHCKSNVNSFSSYYEKYKKSINDKYNIKNGKEPYYINKLEEAIFKDNFDMKLYKKYAYVDENVDYNEFATKLNFEFRNDYSKPDSILKLKKEITLNLQNICTKIGKNVEENDYIKIVNLMIDKFLGIIVENSALEENPKFENMKKFSTDKLIECINTYKEEQLQWLNNNKIKNIIDQINEDEIIFNELINENPNLSKKEELIQNHNLIKQEFLRKITDKNFCENFTKMYALSYKKFSNDIINKLMFHLTVISVYENKKVEDINFLQCNKTIENIDIKGTIKYMYKVCPCQYRNISTDLEKLMHDLKEEYGNSYINKLSRNSIVVFNGEFSRKGKPCEKKAKDSFKFLDNIAGADKDMIYKTQTIYRNIDYRCDNCVVVDDDEDIIKDNLNMFFNCKEEKNKNGVYKE